MSLCREMPPVILDMIEGYIRGVLEFTKAKFYGYIIERNNPQEWRWNWIYKLE